MSNKGTTFSTGAEELTRAHVSRYTRRTECEKRFGSPAAYRILLKQKSTLHNPVHSILTLGQPVLTLTLQRQAPDRVATGVPIFKSQYTDTGPTSPNTDPITPGAWPSNHRRTNFYDTGMTQPQKNPTGFKPGFFRSWGRRLNH